ncbi:hypothetical protein C0J52_14364 [Blattella germanica]|nr:hypothetical protein C0J52_14364 [Blattella germanica]
MQTLVVLVCVVVAATAESCSYSSLCADHTMCKYSGTGSKCNTIKFRGVTSDSDKQAVVDIHNQLRSKVALGKETAGKPGPQPSAANMEKLSWDDELATVAQRWADQCDFGHDSCRKDSRFYVGQNAYIGSSKGSAENGNQDWSKAINKWYNEVGNFSRNDISPFKFTKGTGHYTQVVWADTKYVGCGFIAYKEADGWYNKYYVCNYGPGGNIKETTMYKTGAACSACSGSCETSTGLCL